MKCGNGHSFDDSGTNCPDCAYDRGERDERERCLTILEGFRKGYGDWAGGEIPPLEIINEIAGLIRTND